MELLHWFLINRIMLLPYILLIGYIIVILDYYSKSNLPEKDPKCIWHTTVQELIRVYDGDTFFAHVKGHNPIDKKPVGIRIRGIDTPELKDKNPKVQKKALEAKNVSEELLKSGKIHLYNVSLDDKYGRILADVYVGRKSVAKVLLDKKLAKPYDGGTKPIWK